MLKNFKTVYSKYDTNECFFKLTSQFNKKQLKTGTQ